MGRDAGWLALHGGIAGAAHVILIPEVRIMDIHYYCFHKTEMELDPL